MIFYIKSFIETYVFAQPVIYLHYQIDDTINLIKKIIQIYINMLKASKEITNRNY